MVSQPRSGQQTWSDAWPSLGDQPASHRRFRWDEPDRGQESPYPHAARVLAFLNENKHHEGVPGETPLADYAHRFDPADIYQRGVAELVPRLEGHQQTSLISVFVGQSYVGQREAGLPFARPRPADLQRLEVLHGLEPDWYDDNSVAPTLLACVTAFHILSRITATSYPSPFVSPMVDGGFELSWGKKHTDCLLVTVDPEGDVELTEARRSETGELEFGPDLPGSPNAVVEHLHRLQLS